MKVGTLTQAKMGVGNVIFSNFGLMRGPYVFFTTQVIFCMLFFTFNIMIFGDSASFIEIICSVVR